MVNVEEDAIFEDFCSRIGVANIREYEQRQLRLAQEEGEARLRYDTQIARLMTQYVIRFFLPRLLLFCFCPVPD